MAGRIYFSLCITLLMIFTMGVTFPIFAESQKSNSKQINKIDLKKLAGLYWLNRKIDFAPFGDGNNENVTDVLEIVPYNDQAAYFRTRLFFSNGHMCSLSGVARKEEGKLSYYEESRGKKCIMDIVPAKDKIALIDRTEECRAISCGARGGYHGAIFSTLKKRQITYMDKLTASRQYKDAVKKYKARPEAEKANTKN